MPKHSKVNDKITNSRQEQVKNDSSSTNEASRVEKMKARIDCLQKLRKRSVMFKARFPIIFFSRADQTTCT